MSRLHTQFKPLEDGDPSLSVVNQRSLEMRRKGRSQKFTDEYHDLVREIGDPYLAEMIWTIYGEGSMNMVRYPIKALNGHRYWWQLWKPKNTVLSLIKTREGKAWVWQMLHDAGAWLL